MRCPEGLAVLHLPHERSCIRPVDRLRELLERDRHPLRHVRWPDAARRCSVSNVIQLNEGEGADHLAENVFKR